MLSPIMAEGRSTRGQANSTNTSKASTCIMSSRTFQEPKQDTWINLASTKWRNIVCLLLWEVLGSHMQKVWVWNSVTGRA